MSDAATGPDTGAAPAEPQDTTTQGQQATESWLDSLPEEYRADPSLVTVPDVPTLAKNYLEQAKVIGRKGIIPPGENDPPEKVEQFYNALGRPETPDKYEFVKPDMPEGLAYSEDFEKAFREQAHKLGISQKAAKGLHDWFLPLTMQQAEASREEFAKAQSELKTAWGDKYEANLAQVQRAWKVLADPADTEYLETSGLGNNPAMVRLMFNIAQKMREDSFVTGKTMDQGIDQKILDIERNPALMDERHPDHAGLVKERDRLMRIKYDGKQG